jgi:hypothetical protein
LMVGGSNFAEIEVVSTESTGSTDGDEPLDPLSLNDSFRAQVPMRAQGNMPALWCVYMCVGNARARTKQRCCARFCLLPLAHPPFIVILPCAHQVTITTCSAWLSTSPNPIRCPTRPTRIAHPLRRLPSSSFSLMRVYAPFVLACTQRVSLPAACC